MFPTKSKPISLIGVLALLVAFLIAPQFAHAQTPVSYDLCATTGTAEIVTGTSVPIWGYTLGDCTGSLVAELPGPVLTAAEGEVVQVTLHNNLGEDTALYFPGQAMIPDLIGVASGGSAVYTFTAGQAGTYLYEAGLLSNAQHQVALGMYGMLVVTDPAATYTAESSLVLSEIDPALNSSTSPATFDMRDFAPKYWLINGKAYPDTAPIEATAGDGLLLRYANAGLYPHSMGLLGLHQTLLAVDGSPLPFARNVVVQNIAPGQTMDTAVQLPATPPGGGNYALYDTNLLLHNNGAAGFGGMMTFVTLADGTPPGTGPTTTSVSLTPSSTTSPSPVDLSATIPGAMSAEYFIDTQDGDGSGTAMIDGGGGSGIWTETISSAGLATGDHTIYVHGTDGTTWGAFNFAVLHLDNDGPMTKALVLSPNPSNGSVPVNLTATGDDSMTGGSNITAAEYFIDDTSGGDGNGVTMTVNQTAPIASLNATIAAGLAEGTHTVYVHSQDAFGHWGDPLLATIDLVVSHTGPTTSNVTVAPSPNNGSLPINPGQPSVRVDATIVAAAGTVRAAEGFIDAVGTVGTGIPMTPRDGLFNSATENAYTLIPLTTINTLVEGVHNIWVHGQDSSGNWGAAVSAVLLIDKTLPTVSDVSATPNPTGDAQTTALTASANDASSNIARAEWFDGPDPGKGNGTPMQALDGAFDGPTENLTAAIDVTLWAAGDHTLSVRARDAAGNWSTAVTYVLSVVKPDPIFANSFQAGNTSAWNGGSVGSVSVIPAAALDGDGNGMAVTMAGNTPGYVTDLTPAQESSYHARFYLNPNGALTGNNQAYTIFAGQNAAGTTIFRVQFRRQNAAGGTYQVRASALSAGAFVNTNWFTVNNNSANPIEIAWTSGPAASFSLYVHGGLQQTLTGLDTSAYLLKTAQLGPSAGLVAAASGTLYFDAFVSKRYTVIGP